MSLLPHLLNVLGYRSFIILQKDGNKPKGEIMALWDVILILPEVSLCQHTRFSDQIKCENTFKFI